MSAPAPTGRVRWIICALLFFSVAVNYVDRLVVTSTNTGVVVTNGVRNGYWEGSSPVNVTNHNILSFLVAGTYGLSSAQLCVRDNANTTNRVALANFVDRIVSLRQRVDIPWTNFPTIDRTQVKAIRFESDSAKTWNLYSTAMAAWTASDNSSRVAKLAGNTGG